MNFRNLDILQLKKKIAEQLDHVTCINCCKYYIVPTAATCGHSLCHTCWRGRQSCPLCASQVDKKALRLNSTLQSLTEHAVLLRHTFESLFHIQLDDFNLATDEQQNVKDWLASSQNHFSAPVTDSEQFTEEIVKPLHQITSEIQIHTMNERVKEPERETIKKNIQQEDWDKVEEMPGIETNESLENTVGTRDKETYDFRIGDKDYNANNPRRSSRNKELKNRKPHITNDVSSDKESGKSFDKDLGKISNKMGQNWKNVKKMKKEFSKLNKKNKNKLNISIEMCKKAKPAVNLAGPSKSQQMSYNIDENTPEVPATDEVETKNTDFNNDHQISTYNVNSLPISASDTKHISDNGALPHIQCPKDLNLQDKSKENIKQTNRNITASKVCFFKKGPLQNTFLDTNNTHVINIDNPTFQNQANDKVDTGDIEITIKIGKILTNICIQKKEDAVQFKINTDREVQTSMGNPVVENEHNMQSLGVDTKTQHVGTGTNENIVNTSKDVPVCSQHSTSKAQIEKSIPTKKNTTSADTSTAPFVITESEEKEFADHMENVSFVSSKKNKTQSQKSISKSDCSPKSKLSAKLDGNTSKSKNDIPLLQKTEAIPEDLEFLDEVDIFEGETIKEGNIQPLESAKSTHSAIIMPTVKSKSTSQMKTNKRSRDMCDKEDLSNNKKMKIPQEHVVETVTQEKVLQENNVMDAESENINYDAIMSQVFANINADMENLPKTGTSTQMRTQISNTQKSNTNTFAHLTKPNNQQDNTIKTKNQKHCEENQKCSENVFSLLDKEDSHSETFKTTSHKHLKEIASEPIVGRTVENEGKLASPNDIDTVEIGTPIQDYDDKSIVEETPQKNTSFINNINKDEVTTITNMEVVAQCSSTKTYKSTNESSKQQKDIEDIEHIEDSINVISISDSTANLAEEQKSALETPLTISKFVNKITFRSTPLAKKSLNFSRNVDDPEETICPSSVVAAKTTQEREFMSKAFEPTLESQTQTLGKKRRRANLCIAGSCLMSSEQVMLKELCVQRNWMYVEKYTKELTHLVVGVDNENKSQRSVKYICALANSKWIVTFAWVEKCLLAKGHEDEEPFEALDVSGEPGPRRSRLARTKLLQGITFYCMEPFSIIRTDTLKDVIVAAGGRVASEARGVRASRAPAMLLAEPESTQENRFIYLAMELKIVPMNYEWILDCLGTYTLKPIFNLLLCPATLLPPVIAEWPSELITPCDD